MKLSSPEKFRPTSTVMDINRPGKGRMSSYEEHFFK